MESKRIYLDERAERACDAIIEAGFASSVSAAVRVALAQFSVRVMAATS